MVTDHQVRKLMKLIREGKTLSQASVKSGMSDPTARKYWASGLPSEIQAQHSWCTRLDPFVEVWSEVRALLENEPGLQALTLFAELQRQYPGRFAEGQL